jgi:hypothetical protein
MTTGTKATQSKSIKAALQAFLSALGHAEAGGVTEVCVFEGGKKPTHVGYFNDSKKAAQAIEKCDGKGNIFVTVNPVKPALLARHNNKLVEGTYKKPVERTNDNESHCDSWFFIDGDPKRPRGISSTDEEKCEAREVVKAVRDWLLSIGVPESAIMTCDSGNGFYVLIRTPDCEVTKEHTERKKAFLDFIADKFNTDKIEIDCTVYNPSRLCGALGTLKMKGEDIPERPHRRSAVFTIAGELFDQAKDQRCEPFDLYALAAKIMPKPMPKPNAAGKKAGAGKIWFDARLIADKLSTPKPTTRGFTNYDCPNCGKSGKFWINDENGSSGCFEPETVCDRKILRGKLREIAKQNGIAVTEEAAGTETKQSIFAELSDGRLIEQLHKGVFAVYDGSTIEYASCVECDGVIYEPITGDPCIEDNDLHLPERLTEYGDERLLDEEVENYLSKFCDAPARELKFAAKLVRLTYIQDRLNEVPYLHIIGPSGSGKTRMSDVVGMACHRPYLLVEGTASFAFRISEKFTATLCFDEFNPKVDSDDQQALIQILNAGFQRRRKVPRVEKGANGEFVTRSFRPFGIKIFSGLKLTGSYAFQRRTIPIQLSITTNKDIPYCDDGLIDELSAPLREKLTLWRLRNLARDYRSLIRTTETIFKSKEVMPGFVQIGVPLAMLIEDKKLQGEFIATMETRTSDVAEEKKESFDGRIVGLIHSRLFDVDENGEAKWKVKGNLPELIEGEACEGLRVELLITSLNDGVSEKKKITDSATFSRYRLKPLGFKTKQLTRGAYKGQTAVIYDPPKFTKIFNSYSFSTPAIFASTPLPADLASTASTHTINEDSKEFAESRQDEDKKTASTPQVPQTQLVKEGVEAVEAEFQEDREGGELWVSFGDDDDHSTDNGYHVPEEIWSDENRYHEAIDR